MWRKQMAVVGIIAAGSLLTGCFGSKDVDLSCDDPKFYEAAKDGPRLRAPDGLDELDEYKMMPVPQASAEPKPAGSPCVDRPPNLLRQDKDD